MRNLLAAWNKCFRLSKRPMLFIGKNFHILACNEAFRRKAGYSVDDLLRMNFADLMVEKPYLDRSLRKLITVEKYFSFTIQLKLLHHKKEVIHSQVCVNNFFDHEGNHKESLIILDPKERDIRNIFHLN